MHILLEASETTLASDEYYDCDYRTWMKCLAGETVSNRIVRREVSEASEHYRAKSDDFIQTFGGESFIDGWEFAEYGIAIGEWSVDSLAPKQAIELAVTLVDHLIINGHVFEIAEVYEQDRKHRLICKD